VSRTVLAERFVMPTGIPPIQYLTKWRLALAYSSGISDKLAEVLAAARDKWEASGHAKYGFRAQSLR
jgi:hypothetical protein